MPIPLAAALEVGSAVGGAIKGIGTFFGAKSDEQKAQDELRKLKDPFYKIQNEYIQNRDIAGNMASGGLPESTKNYVTQEAQRGLGTSLSALGQNGGGVNDVARLNDVYMNSIDKVAAEDAQAKLGNIQNFFNANKEVAGQKTIQWTLNEYRPFERKLKEITQRIGAAKQNQNTGLNTAISSVGAAGTALSNNDLMNKLFANNKAPSINVQPSGVQSVDVPTPDYRTASSVQIPQQANTNNNQQQQQSVDRSDPNNNPFAPGGFWDGNEWVP
jgi:hypothetical protein